LRHDRNRHQAPDFTLSEQDGNDLGEFCYYDIPEIGSLIELLYVTELPPPEKTIG
jgi:hypothetical protein